MRQIPQNQRFRSIVGPADLCCQSTGRVFRLAGPRAATPDADAQGDVVLARSVDRAMALVDVDVFESYETGSR
jgi:hypothetical protein